MYYFAYGSNLDKQQMKERCPDCKPLHPAVLPNYKLIFAGWSRQWKGGVASVRRMTGQKVSGAVYEINERDLAKLDKYEGYPTQYNRIKVMIFDEDGTSLEAFTYLMTGNVEEAAPSREYAQIMERGYRDWGII